MLWLRLFTLGSVLGGVSAASLALTITIGIPAEGLFLASAAGSALSLWTGIFLAMRKT